MINKKLVITALSLISLHTSAYELKVLNANGVAQSAKQLEKRPAIKAAPLLSEAPAKPVAKEKEMLLPTESNKKPMDILATLDRTQDQSRCILVNNNKALTFYDIVDRAMCNDPTVRERWLQLKNYEIERDESYSDYLPRIEYQGNAGRSHAKSTYKLDPLDLTYKSNRTGIDHTVQLTWLLFDFGKREAKVSKTKNEYLMYKMMVRSDLQDTLLQVAQKYFNVMAAKANLAAVQNNESIALRSYETSRAKRLGGIGVLADELQTKNYTISSEYRRHQAEGNLRLAMGELAIMIGYPMNLDIPFASSDFEIPTSFKMTAIDTLLDSALKQHPKILLAKQQILASKDSIKMAQRTFLPQIYLSGAVKSDDQRAYSSSSSLSNYGYTAQSSPDRSTSANVGVSVRVPIFNSLTNFNQVRQAKNQLNMAENQYLRFEREVSNAVWTAYQQLQVATRNAETARRLLETAKESYELAEGRYNSGIGNILELLNTQNDLSSAEMNSVEVKVQWHTARLMLASSLGMLEMDAIQNSSLN